MSEDLNLPASLERLEINPERLDCCKTDLNRKVMLNLSPEPECTLQGLSLRAECPKGNCNCNRKRDKEVTVKRLPFKRTIVRRSKLNPLVLRSPVLKLNPHQPNAREVASTSPSDTIPINRLGEDDEAEGLRCPPPSPSALVPLPPTPSSCALQARTSPDDTSIDELASYFDVFVHIPKKMSFMAEMMYT